MALDFHCTKTGVLIENFHFLCIVFDTIGRTVTINCLSFWFRCFPCLGDYDGSCFPIRRGGPQSQCVSFVRSFPVCQGAKRESREQISNITSYVDGSMIYGSTDFVNGQVRDGDCKLLNYFWKWFSKHL